jgi:hypothetical protein
MYIPASNIVETGFTSGNQFAVNSTQLPYTGYYHKDTSNVYWSGQTHDNSSVVLKNLNTNNSTDNNITRNNIVNFGYTKLNPKIFPQETFTSDFIMPTDQDYTDGFFIRYILKPTVGVNNIQSLNFIEVKSNKFTQVSQNSDLKTLYKSINLIWKLTGPLYDVYKDNIRIVSGIIDTNKRSIQETEKLIPNLSLYLIDPLQFAKISSSDKFYYPALGGMYKDKGPRGSRY